ncbi:MAG: PEP-CTERM sorting domain-containing protein [Planctomycetota bacterium]
MKKFAVCAAVLALMATPALADLAPSAYNAPLGANLTPTGEHTVGVWSGGAIVTEHTVLAAPSDTIHLTFAFHWGFITSVSGLQFQHAFAYDNDEVSVLSMTPVGPFAGGSNNFPGPSAWQGTQYNPGGGFITVGDVLGTGVPLWENPASGSPLIGASQVFPFMEIDLRVENGVQGDTVLDAIAVEAALLFTLGAGTMWTGGAIANPSYGAGVVPEPASLSLLGMAVVAFGAGAWRRRRR